MTLVTFEHTLSGERATMISVSYILFSSLKETFCSLLKHKIIGYCLFRVLFNQIRLYLYEHTAVCTYELLARNVKMIVSIVFSKVDNDPLSHSICKFGFVMHASYASEVCRHVCE